MLGWDGSDAPELSSQVVTGFVTKELFLGILGLSARPVNITDWNDQYESPLTALVANETVGSSFWAYTAGARYRTPQAYGSLTLGGYDSARGNVDNVLEVSFGVNTYRDLELVLKGVGISSPDGTTTMRDLSIWMFVDSTIPEIWLPVSACQAFESAFCKSLHGSLLIRSPDSCSLALTWDNVTGMYPVNDTLHALLTSRDQTVSFVLADTADSNAETTTIVLSYSSFDLTATTPASGPNLNGSQRYFPLKRAENETQYVLGRTFLQEAYVAVDYDRSKWYVSPATFPDDASFSNITAMVKPHHDGDSPLNAGAIAGITIGALLVLVVLPACVFIASRKRRKERYHLPWASALPGVPVSGPMSHNWDNITAQPGAQQHNGNYYLHFDSFFGWRRSKKQIDADKRKEDQILLATSPAQYLLATPDSRSSDFIS